MDAIAALRIGCVLLAIGCADAQDGPGAGGSAGLGGSSGANSGGSAGAAFPRDAGPPVTMPDAGALPPISSALVGRVRTTPVSKLDLLLVIDNSRGMSDKQALLGLPVQNLVERLVNPWCFDAQGGAFTSPPGQACPDGQEREFPPIADINVGIISSSLGDVGANAACPAQGFPNYLPDRIDLAHLIGSLPRAPSPALSAAKPQGFLAWRAGGDLAEFNQNVQQMLDVVGERGCGFEAPLESWYRFLADPFPYESLVRVVCPGSTSGALNCVQQRTDLDDRIVLDTELLAQRSAFLRPDSLVAVVMLSDENDCSTQVGNQTWVINALDDTRPMFRASSACDEDPNAKCCYCCPLGPPSGCTADPICNADPENEVLENRLPAPSDGRNLRCYQQKRRFGVDFLYPIERYVNALREPELCWNALDLGTEGCTAGDVVPNPLLLAGRPRELVFFGAIIGVPWQAIASSVDAQGRPLADTQLRFQSPAELNAAGTWAQILGSSGVRWRPPSGDQPEVASVPAVAPLLPQMLESEVARAGVVSGNPINAREYDTTQGALPAGTPDDLQYACIFPLPTPRDCSVIDPATGPACDCFAGTNDRPLCEQEPGVSAAGTTQYWSKAYPGVRQLEVLKAFGQNSVLGSICARNVSVTTAADYAYRPSLDALVERFSDQLRQQCLPEPLPFDTDADQTPCRVVEASSRRSGCSCNVASGRRAPEADVQVAIRSELARVGSPLCEGGAACQSACVCEVQAVEVAADSGAEAALRACREEPDVAGLEGWCYLDLDRNIGNPALVEACPPTQRSRLRFVGVPPAPDTFTICPTEPAPNP